MECACASVQLVQEIRRQGHGGRTCHGRLIASYWLLNPDQLYLGFWIVLHSLFIRLTFPLDFAHHGLLLRFVRDMATLETLIASRWSRVWNSARLWRHRVENVKRITITVETLQGQSSVHQLSLLRFYWV
jgi:hypothetical protein